MVVYHNDVPPAQPPMMPQGDPLGRGPGAPPLWLSLIALRNLYEQNPEAFSREELIELDSLGKQFGIEFPIHTSLKTMIGNLLYNAADELVLGLLPDSLGYELFGRPYTTAEKIAAGLGGLGGFAGSVMFTGPFAATKLLRGAGRAMALGGRGLRAAAEAGAVAARGARASRAAQASERLAEMLARKMYRGGARLRMAAQNPMVRYSLGGLLGLTQPFE